MASKVELLEEYLTQYTLRIDWDFGLVRTKYRFEKYRMVVNLKISIQMILLYKTLLF